ncbi:MAG TPA: hypothetical protein VMV69_18265 [Pirellulales bacterium]|nr:hypothetical protein [Pirellulales bacterium]
MGATESVVKGRTATSAASCAPAGAPSEVRAYVSEGWQIQESARFRVCCLGALPADCKLAPAIEALRTSLSQKWLGDVAVAAWQPKCDVILHTRLGAYLQAVPGGARTVGSSLIEVEHGRIVTRRIDVRADLPGWLNAAVGHELTHVILADVFANGVVPQWADEGMAVLADTAEKQLLHLRDLHIARRQGNHLRMVELFTLAGHPGERQAAFYGQSASVVKFLVARGTPEQFVRFVQASSNEGYDRALRDVYQIHGVGELERHWSQSVVVEESVALAR